MGRCGCLRHLVAETDRKTLKEWASVGLGVSHNTSDEKLSNNSNGNNGTKRTGGKEAEQRRDSAGKDEGAIYLW